MNRRRFKIIGVLFAVVLSAFPVAAEPVAVEGLPLKALIVTGQNNHDWKTSTPILKQLLDQTGLFDVDVAVSPRAGENMDNFKPDFAHYDVVVLDYNGDTWPKETREAFVEYVRTGGGVVVYHAADNAFADWDQYNRIIGLGGWGGRDEKAGPYVYWREGNLVRDRSPGKAGSHGKQRAFEVIIRNREHPITVNLPIKWMHAKDELYSNLRGPAENLTVLATAYSDPQQGGSGKHEPVLFTVRYGKGRIFHTVLGHVGRDSKTVPSLTCVGFITTFQRGAEWAATGKVIQNVPDDFPSPDKVSRREDLFTPARLNRLFDEIAHYQFGRSREPLYSMDLYIRLVLDVPDIVKRVEKRFLELLQRDATTPAGKQYICKKLSIIGTEDSVPVLAAMLTKKALSPEMQPADMARYALERIPAASAGRALLQALDETSGKVKIGIINSLGRRREKRAVTKLAAILNDPDEEVVGAAMAALGEIGTIEAADALSRPPQGLKPQVRIIWADACLACAERLLEQGQTGKALQIYNFLYRPEQPEPIRLAAFRGRILAEPEIASSALMAALASRDERMQSMAIGLLRQIHQRQVIKTIAENYSRLAVSSQVRVLSGLADVGDKAALPAVLEACDSPEVDVRIAALKALGRLGGAEQVGLLAERAATADGDERQAARQSLYRLAGPGVDQRILSYLSTAEPKVKLELIRSVGARKIHSAVPLLLQTAQAPQPQVRIESIRALNNTAGPDDFEALLKLLLSAKTQAEQAGILNTMLALIPKIADKSRCSDMIVSAYGSVEDVRRKSCLLQILGKFGGDAALETVNKALQDDDEEVRKAAIRALGNWPNPEPMEKLKELVTTGRNQVERVLAFRGLVRIIGLVEDRPVEAKVVLFKEAMELAPDINGKRLVLSGLGNLDAIEALLAAAAYLDQETLSREAQAAVVQIAGRIYGRYPKHTKAFLAEVLKVTDNESIRQQAAKIISNIEHFEGYITTWEVSGPYTRENTAAQELFDIAFAPEKGGASKARWQPMPFATDNDRPWLLDLGSRLGGRERVAYLRTNVWSGTARKVRLLVGSNDGIKVWLNGKVVHQNNVLRTITPDEDEVEVNLRRGWNCLLMKVTQGGGTWSACARFVDADGKSIDDLMYQPGDPVEIRAGLFLTGGDLSAWGPRTGSWQVVGSAYMDPDNPKRLATRPGSGVIVNGPDGRTVDLLSKAKFGDVRAHIEFMVPRNSNSGVYFMGRYEVQILDSWMVKKPKFSDCGGIYQRWDENRRPKGYEGHPPRVNASLPPGQWQSYDVIFRAPRFDSEGNKIANARFEKVVHNGIVVHENVEVTGPTRASAFKDEQPAGPLMLQGDHGPVAYRNIWVLPLDGN